MTTEPAHEVLQLDRRERRAAIPHECDLCREPIQPGQRYARIVFLVDGIFQVMKYHLAEKHEDQCLWCRADKRTKAKGAK